MKYQITSAFFLLFAATVTLISCDSGKNSDGSTVDTGGKDSVKSVLDIAGKYEGTIPCVSCTGIKMELLLNPDSSFHLKEIHQGTASGDSVVQKFGKLSPFNHFTKFLLKNRQDNSETWIKPVDGNALQLVGPDGLDLPGGAALKLVAVSKVIAVYPEYKVTYKLATPTPEKSFVYSKNPKGDITIDKAWIDQANESEKAMIAWYAYLFNNGCNDSGCQLPKALGIDGGQEELLKYVSAKLNVDSLHQKTGLKADKTRILGNLFCGKSADKVNFNYTVTDSSGQAFSGNDNFGPGSTGMRLERHMENKIQQFTPGNQPKPAGGQRPTPAPGAPRPSEPRKVPAERK